MARSIKRPPRPGEIDPGRLERVGWKTPRGNGRVEILGCGADHTLNISDHVPIVMVVEVNLWSRNDVPERGGRNRKQIRNQRKQSLKKPENQLCQTLI